MCAVRSASSSASLAWASLSHCTSLVSRSFKLGIGPFLLDSSCSAVCTQFALDGGEHCVAGPMGTLVKRHRGELRGTGSREPRDDILGLHALVSVPGLVDVNLGTGTLLGTVFAELFHQHRVLGDVSWFTPLTWRLRLAAFTPRLGLIFCGG